VKKKYHIDTVALNFPKKDMEVETYMKERAPNPGYYGTERTLKFLSFSDFNVFSDAFKICVVDLDPYLFAGC
jgi:hypothetical protein